MSDMFITRKSIIAELGEFKADVERLTAECNRRKAEERRCLDHIYMLCAERDRLRAALELVRDAVEWNNPETNGVLMRVRRALAEGTKE